MAITLTLGNDPNSLKLKVNNIQITPDARVRGGIIEDAVIVKISRYNLDDLLVQLIEDYGEEMIIKRMSEL